MMTKGVGKTDGQAVGKPDSSGSVVKARSYFEKDIESYFRDVDSSSWSN
jgi:hypothetical protein